jgi:hypothetical protein
MASSAAHINRKNKQAAIFRAVELSGNWEGNHAATAAAQEAQERFTEELLEGQEKK